MLYLSFFGKKNLYYMGSTRGFLYETNTTEKLDLVTVCSLLWTHVWRQDNSKSLAWYWNSVFVFVSDEQDGDDLNNNKPKNTIWKHVTEMDFNRKEFQKYGVYLLFFVLRVRCSVCECVRMHQRKGSQLSRCQNKRGLEQNNCLFSVQVVWTQRQKEV